MNHQYWFTSKPAHVQVIHNKTHLGDNSECSSIVFDAQFKYIKDIKINSMYRFVQKVNVCVWVYIRYTLSMYIFAHAV